MEVSLSRDDATVYYTSLRKDNRRRRNTRRKTAARRVPLSVDTGTIATQNQRRI